MKKYIWDIENLKQEYKKLIKLIENNNLDEENKKIVEIKLDILSDMLDSIKTKNVIINKLNLPIFDIDFSIEDAKTSYSTQITPLQHEIMKKAYDEILNNDFEYTDKNTLDIFLTQNKKILLSKETFLKAFGNINDFNKIINPKNNFLYLTNKLAKSCFFPYDKDCFILSNNSNNINSFCSLNHELGHYYEYCFNNFFENPSDEKGILYEEVTSLLFEHICLDVLKSHGIISEQEKLDMQKFMMFCNTSASNNYFLIKTIINNPNPTFLDNIRVHFNSQTLMNTIYYYSYIIAINLYYQFINDPKLSIKNLKHILLKFDPENELKLLEESDIDLSGHVFKKHINKMKRN